MPPLPDDRLWRRYGLSRRGFLRQFGLGAGALTLSPCFLNRLSQVCQAQSARVPVYLVKNGDCLQNVAKVLELMGGISRFVNADDVVVIKGNAQWPQQGYTHTGCIKGLAEQILRIPNYSGEIHICDNVQNTVVAGENGFDAIPSKRTHNWPDHNWDSLAAEYQAAGKKVASTRWSSGPFTTWNSPADGPGWVRSVFPFYDYTSYISYPVFASSLTPGRLLDMKRGVWEDGRYTGQKVKAIFMPTLNNHGRGVSDYAGVTSAVKSFFGATEMASWKSYRAMHSASFTLGFANRAGELSAKYIRELYSPVLYITAAMWAGHYGRTGNATETKTVLACENPVTLDYVSCREVISPYASYLNPDQDNNTRKQLLGCVSGGIGTINPAEFEVISYDFANPGITRIDVERKIRDFKQGKCSEQEVKDVVRGYMESP